MFCIYVTLAETGQLAKVEGRMDEPRYRAVLPVCTRYNTSVVLILLPTVLKLHLSDFKP